MPNGIPVATVALNGAKNAAILATSIIGSFDESVAKTLDGYKKNLESEVIKKAEKLQSEGWKNSFDK